MKSILDLEFIPKKDFMLEALKLAQQALEDGEVPVGAVIIDNDIIIGSGRNRREKGKNTLFHAEMEAISAACENRGDWRLSGCHMYVTLEPCSMCAGAIANARIDRLIYAAEDEKSGFCGSVANVLDLTAQCSTKIYKGFMEEQAKDMLKNFFKELRRE